jgi:hypothetical protein
VTTQGKRDAQNKFDHACAQWPNKVGVRADDARCQGETLSDNSRGAYLLVADDARDALATESFAQRLLTRAGDLATVTPENQLLHVIRDGFSQREKSHTELSYSATTHHLRRKS